MGTKHIFDEKLAIWFSCQIDFFQRKDIQEKIFDLPSICKEQRFTQEDMELFNELCSSLLKLSFIIKNHSLEAEKLVEYLNS